MLIILDRDGVINFESKDYIKSPQEWKAIPGSIKAIAKLTQVGHTLVIATNQSGVGRKLLSLDMLNRIHRKMLSEIKKTGGHIEKIYFCPHRPDEHCDCRKPRTGLFEKIFQDYPVHPRETLMIGDSLRDLQAGAKMGCQLILVKTGNGKSTLKELPHFHYPVRVFDDLMSVAQKFLGE